jgi:hypothetical protein
MGVNREDIINGLASGISAVYLPTGKMNLGMEGGQGELIKIGMEFIGIEEKIGLEFIGIEEKIGLEFIGIEEKIGLMFADIEEIEEEWG